MCLTKEYVDLARMRTMALPKCSMMDLNYPFNSWLSKRKIDKDIFTNILDLTQDALDVELS